jgi:hypothetical protein
MGWLSSLCTDSPNSIRSALLRLLAAFVKSVTRYDAR